VDDDESVRTMMNRGLERKGFEVVAAASVTEALRRIATENFDVLITDLHMPNPSDGFAVVTAMRHSQPEALTLLVSGYPDVQSSMAAIVLEADEIIVKPFEIGRLTELVQDKVLNRRPTTRLSKERVGAVLQRCVTSVVEGWLARAKQSSDINCLLLSDEERTGHLPKLVEDLARRLGLSSDSARDSDASPSPAAAAHGELRYRQGYTPAMLVHESRILQVTIFGTLQSNLEHLDFSLLLPDVMAIADEVDSQLTQAIDSYMKLMKRMAA
jgi:DNA-binding response OmpR family regulator